MRRSILESWGGPHRSWLAPALLVLLALFGLHCSDDRATISVSVSGLTTDVTKLRFSATLSSRELSGSQPEVSPAADSVSFRLDSQETGLLIVTVAAYGSDGCQIAGGDSQLDVTDSTASYSMSLALLFDSDHEGCKVIVRASGDGTGQLLDSSGNLFCDFSTGSSGTGSSATGTSCTTARYNGATAAIGSTVFLAANPADHSYLAGWSGACTGTGNCRVGIAAEPSNVTVSFLHDRLCPGQYCWEHPLPQGNDLYAVYEVASDDVWIAGEVGTILHWNGVYTVAVTSNTQQAIHAIWGSSHTNLWAVGTQGTIIHWQGADWSTSLSNITTHLNAIWGSDTNNIWAVGDAGTILNPNYTPPIRTYSSPRRET